MTSEKKHKINVWIPESLWKQIERLGYDSPTKATIAAYEALATQEAQGSSQEAIGSSPEEKLSELKKQIEDMENSNREKNTEIERLQAVIMEAPDPLELARLQERNEGLKLLLEEKEKRIQELTQYKEDIGAFANYFKNVEVKQIEAPAEKKKRFWKFW